MLQSYIMQIKREVRFVEDFTLGEGLTNASCHPPNPFSCTDVSLLVQVIRLCWREMTRNGDRAGRTRWEHV